MEKKKIEISDNNFLEIEYKADFLQAVREHLEIPKDKGVTDEDIKEFVYKSFKNSLDNAQDAEYVDEFMPTDF
tara:strand:+ start:13277 stop:13495 length:219 start_codon:yes stop_codon:yes gene_type:complete